MEWHWWQLFGSIGVGIILGAYLMRAIDEWLGGRKQ